MMYSESLVLKLVAVNWCGHDSFGARHHTNRRGKRRVKRLRDIQWDTVIAYCSWHSDMYVRCKLQHHTLVLHLQHDVCVGRK